MGNPQPETNNAILFICGVMVRTTRLIFSGMTAVANKHGWRVQYAIPPHGADATYIRKLVSFWHPLAIVACYGHDKNIPFPTHDLTIPFICIDLDPSKLSRRRMPLPPRIGFVNCDSPAIAKIAAKTLLEQDFAAYAYVSATTRLHWSEQRKLHFRNAIELNGQSCQCFDGTGLVTSDPAPSRRLGRWLSALPKPCGLLAANDNTAVQVLSVAEHEGIKVPDELCVLGIDDYEDLCESTNPPLSSIRLDLYGGGGAAGEMIHKLLLSQEPQKLADGYGAVRVTVRQSTRRLLKHTPSIRMALETIRLRATDGITAADIIPLIGGSRRSSERKFRSAVGYSILEGILNVRFEKVKELLATPTPLKTVAMLAGFSSSNNLQRLFKARFGTTLSEYRKRLT